MLSDILQKSLKVRFGSRKLVAELVARLDVSTTPADDTAAATVLEGLDISSRTKSKMKNVLGIWLCDKRASDEIAGKINGMINVLQAQADGNEVAAVAAAFSGQVNKQSGTIVLTADDVGVSGNDTILNFDGVITVQNAVDAWNVANPADSIIVTSGVTSVVPINGQTIQLSGGDVSTQASFNNKVLVLTTAFVIDADTAGAAGNITLTGDGTKTIAVLISDWNTAHPSNTVTLASGTGSQIPANTEVIELTGGADATDSNVADTLAAMGSDDMSDRAAKRVLKMLGKQVLADEFISAYNDMVDAISAITPL